MIIEVDVVDSWYSVSADYFVILTHANNSNTAAFTHTNRQTLLNLGMPYVPGTVVSGNRKRFVFTAQQIKDAQAAVSGRQDKTLSIWLVSPFQQEPDTAQPAQCTLKALQSNLRRIQLTNRLHIQAVGGQCRHIKRPIHMNELYFHPNNYTQVPMYNYYQINDLDLGPFPEIFSFTLNIDGRGLNSISQVSTLLKRRGGNTCSISREFRDTER